MLYDLSINKKYKRKIIICCSTFNGFYVEKSNYSLTLVQSHSPPHIYSTRPWLLIGSYRDSKRTLLHTFEDPTSKSDPFLVEMEPVAIVHRVNLWVRRWIVERTILLVEITLRWGWDDVDTSLEWTRENRRGWSVSTVEVQLSQMVEWNYTRMGVNWA